jgi:hypothetical protein
MLDLEDNKEWEVKEVKDKLQQKGKTSYLVKWKGWPTEYNLWVFKADIRNAQEAIQSFRKTRKAKTK